MYEVEIVFKSGHRKVVTCEEFRVKSRHNQITLLEWQGLNPPNFFLDLDSVESVWQTDA